MSWLWLLLLWPVAAFGVLALNHGARLIRDRYER